jgi:hypothetical protein
MMNPHSVREKHSEASGAGGHISTNTFEKDYGSTFRATFLFSFKFSFTFFLLIVVLAEVKISDKFDVMSFGVELLVSIALAAIISLHITRVEIVRIQFTDEGLRIASSMFLRFGRGRHGLIPFESCKVIETRNWRIRDFYTLVIKVDERVASYIADVSWSKTYQQIRMELSRRLPEKQCVLLLKE